MNGFRGIDTGKRGDCNGITLVKGECGGCRITGSIGKIVEIEIPLQFSIFTGRSVDADENNVKPDLFS